MIFRNVNWASACAIQAAECFTQNSALPLGVSVAKETVVENINHKLTIIYKLYQPCLYNYYSHQKELYTFSLHLKIHPFLSLTGRR
jgi:hypothetical protein